uniref:DUF4794 domain-containing protein n=1 Tax=Bactrocera latifrons TaxID=174628 RepID=A0A0K8V3X4_BACLA
MLCLKTGVICLLFAACVLAEAPYAATGWRPLRPFNLPTDNLPPPRDIEKQRQPPQPIFDVELKKQRIEYVGQIQENILSSPNAYLPPRRQSTDLDLKVQRPPYQKPGPQFVLQTAGYRPQGQQNTRIFQISNSRQQPTGEQGSLRPQKPKHFAFGVQQQSTLSRPAQTYGPPSNGGEQKFTINYPDDIEPHQADAELEENKNLPLTTRTI